MRAPWMIPASLAALRTALREAGLPSIRTSTRSVTSGSCWPGDRVLELALDPLGDEAQGQLAQGRQVGLGEEPLQGDLGALRRIDVAVLHALPERVRAMSTSSISSAPSSTSSGSRSLTGAPVIVATASATLSRCCTFMRGDDVDARVADQLDILPALARPTRDVRVGQLVDQRNGRPAREHRVGVHLLDDDPAVLDPAARDDLEAVEQLDRMGPAVRLDEADDQVRPARQARWPSSSIL